MSKSGHYNKYAIVKKMMTIWEQTGCRNVEVIEIWRIDNKNAHLHRLYDVFTNKFGYPRVNNSMKKKKFFSEFSGEMYTVNIIETREELDSIIFLEMI